MKTKKELKDEIKELREKLSKYESEQEWIEVPELNIKITKVIHHNKDYNKIMKLKPKDCRLLGLEELKIIVNNYGKKLNLWKGKNDFFFEQPFNKNENFVAGLVASSDSARVDCLGHPDYVYAPLGVIFVKEQEK